MSTAAKLDECVREYLLDVHKDGLTDHPTEYTLRE
jgi:hypothetical protein